MVALNPSELAGVLFEANQPDAKPLDEQGDHLKAVYQKAAEAVIAWLVDKAINEQHDAGVFLGLLDELAEQLAYKYNHPGHFVDGVRQTFENYAAIVGEENLTDEVKRARQL